MMPIISGCPPQAGKPEGVWKIEAHFKKRKARR
jgi:hypothetical protein